MPQMICIEIVCSNNDRYVLPMFFFPFHLKNKKKESSIYISLVPFMTLKALFKIGYVEISDEQEHALFKSPFIF